MWYVVPKNFPEPSSFHFDLLFYFFEQSDSLLDFANDAEIGVKSVVSISRPVKSISQKTNAGASYFVL